MAAVLSACILTRYTNNGLNAKLTGLPGIYYSKKLIQNPYHIVDVSNIAQLKLNFSVDGPKSYS